MLLTFANYIKLLTALDEYSKCTLEKKDLQKAIFDRYAGKYGSFYAENAKGNKRFFIIKLQGKKHNKNERKIFIQFMDVI